MSGIEKLVVQIPNTTAFRPPLVSTIVEYFVAVLTLTAFIYGVTSWCILKKFRHFRNYVYISAIISSLLRLSTVSIIIPGIVQVIKVDDKQILDICRYICTYFTTVQNYWLLVICYIFYRDIVKVFCGHISRKYLKCSLFAWGVPFTAFLIYDIFISFNADILVKGSIKRIAANWVEVSIIVSPLVFNCIIYLVVVCSLCRRSSTVPSATNTWRRFYIATLLFVLSDIIVLSSFVWDTMSLAFIIRAIMSKLQQIVISLFLPLVKGNRDLWQEYFSNRLKSKSNSTKSQIKV